MLMAGVGPLVGLLNQLPGTAYIGIGFVPLEPEFSPFDVHIRFTEREWIDVRLVFQVRQGVVDKPVSAFIGTNCVNDVQQSCVRFEAPIIFRYFRSRMVGPFWETTFFDVFDTFLLSKMLGGRRRKMTIGRYEPYR